MPDAIPSEATQSRALREQAHRDAFVRTGVHEETCVICGYHETPDPENICEWCRKAGRVEQIERARVDREVTEVELSHWDRRAARDGYTNEDRW